MGRVRCGVGVGWGRITGKNLLAGDGGGRCVAAIGTRSRSAGAGCARRKESGCGDYAWGRHETLAGARFLRAHLGWASRSVMRSGMSLLRSLSEVVVDVFLGIVLRFFGASAPMGPVELMATSWSELLEKK